MRRFLRIRKRDRASQAPPALILAYHRIGKEALDPWQMCVEPAHFRAQLDYVRRHFNVVPLTGLDRPGGDGRPRACLTFDDGYLDNYDIAVPLLRRLGLPAAFFVPAQNLTTGALFWWELVDYLFWKQASGTRAELRAGGERFILRLPGPAAREEALRLRWSAAHPPPNGVCRHYLALCAWLKSLPADRQEEATAQLLTLAGPAAGAYPGFAKMGRAALTALVRDGFELGAHTMRHPALGRQDVRTQRWEIEEGGRLLEDLQGGKVRCFAYPHGELNAGVRSLVRRAGYRFACTTEEKCVRDRVDRLALPRITVVNEGAEALGARLQYCLNPPMHAC